MRKSIFQDKRVAALCALTAVLAWGFAFPLIKLGFAAFGIGTEDTWSKTLFAGVRFTIAGLVTLGIAAATHRPFRVSNKKDAGLMLALGLVNTALHYFCFYMGLSFSSGSRASMLNAMGTFLLVIMACVCFREEHMDRRKVLGCVLGFGGVLLLNVGGDVGVSTVKGDVMIVCNAVCSACGGLLTRVVTRRVDALVATGVSLATGGAMLLVIGLLLGGALPVITMQGLLILLLLVMVSSVAFSLYNQLLSFHPVSEIGLYNALTPVFGAMLSCLLLGEAFLPKYVLAGALIAAGVAIVNRAKGQTAKAARL